MGVTVTLNSYINGARAVRKTQTTNVQTFQSGEKGYLGYVYNGKVTRFNNRVHGIKLPLPATLPPCTVPEYLRRGPWGSHPLRRG